MSSAYQYSPACIAAIALYIICSFLFFRMYRLEVAIVISMVAGTLFLPVFEIKLVSGIPFISRELVTGLTVFLLAWLHDSGKVRKFGFHPADLAIVLHCLSPAVSSLCNDLGWYDAGSMAMGRTVVWLPPYLCGRIFLRDLRDLRRVALGFFWGGIIYVPFCLLEIRISPQLHRIVYGYFQHSFSQQVRYGGFRPMVFLNHGLTVAFWMACATICGAWLKEDQRGGGSAPVTMVFAFYTLLVTTILCKTVGPLVYLLVGMTLLYGRTIHRARTAINFLIFLPILYVGLRASKLWDGNTMVDFSAKVFGDERAQSLAFRVMNENLLVERALENLWFGWGGWNRAVSVGDDGLTDHIIYDSLWMITFSQNGLWGLLCLYGALLFPAWLFLRRIPPSRWSEPDMVPLLTLIIILLLTCFDSLINAEHLVYLEMVLGACTGVLISLGNSEVVSSQTPHGAVIIRASRGGDPLPPSDELPDEKKRRA